MPIDRDGDGPPLRRPESRVSLTPGEGRSGDLRATPFTDDVFNDDYHGRRATTSEGNKSYSVIIGVVLGVAIAGGAGWYFVRGAGLTFTPNTVGFIKADPTPYKIKPDSPGGMDVPNQDKLVYDRVAKGDAPKRVENLLPPVEEPKAPPMKPEAVPAPETPKAEVAKVEPPKVEPEAPKPEPAKVEVAKAEPPKVEAPKVEAKPAADPLAAAVAAATAGRTSATGPINVAPQSPATAPAAEPAPTTPETKTAAAVPTPAPAVPTAGPGFQIQLASVLSEEAAAAEWKRVAGKNKDLLGAFMPLVTKADLGGRGVFYRLRAGPLPDKAAADALCASLAAANVGCIVIKP